jgi:hypothetical protein
VVKLEYSVAGVLNQIENFVPIRVKSYLLMYLSVFSITYNSFRAHYARKEV